MFPSQPQIGQDMAKERQQQAERIRQAHLATSASKESKPGPVRRGWIDATILGRRLSDLIAHLRIRRSKPLPVEEE